ncbi:hypothetical protein [Bacillus kexueae]|uniref:hypothetical protein n=1 Tax=Aeribacillus kexueae TaxID=2078952 RepID=UPI001FAECB0D|nr:hypothetical protein [Bacillus kexueae]
MFDWFVHSFIILLYGFIVFVILFYRYQLKKSLERVESGEGISFYSVRRENDWKAVQPLSRKSKDYLIIHWCAIALPFLYAGILFIIFVFNILDTWFFIYGNFLLFHILPFLMRRFYFYLLNDGLIIHGVFYHWDKIERVEVEKITKWHPLYGLDKEINDGYRIVFFLNQKMNRKQTIVLVDEEEKNTIVDEIEKQEKSVLLKDHTDFRTYFV